MFAPMMEITTKIGCSLQCKYCPQQQLITSYYSYNNMSEFADLGNEMSIETFRLCLDKIPSNIDIHFSGMCEPWLNPQCSKMVLYSAKKGHRIHIFTTLEGMNMVDYNIVKSISPNTFVLHIPDAEGFSGFNITGEYLQLIRTVISDVIEGTFRIDSFSCHGSVHPAIKKMVEDTNIQVNKSINDRAGNIKCEDSRFRASILHGKIECKWCSGTSLDKNVLLPNGTVLLCCMDYSMGFPLGNLIKQSYQDIAEGQLKQQYREMMRDETNGMILCRTCSRAMIIENNNNN